MSSATKGFLEGQVNQAMAKRIVLKSMSAQKALQKYKKLLSMCGSVFETLLNILGNRTNLNMFLKNLFMRGKVVVPDKTTASFVSFIGHLDNRVDLDKNIKPGSNKYFANLSAMASKLAYENQEFIKAIVEKRWEMKLLGAYSFRDERYQGETTQAFMFHDKNPNSDTIIVAFRGTEPFSADDWCTDLDLSWNKLPGIKGRVHSGFLNALDLNLHGDTKTAYHTITEDLKRHLNNNHATKFMVTGHSLGGALAALFPAVLELHNEDELLARLEAVYTFGQPRVGDEKFGRFMKEKILERYGVKYYRFVYSNDVIPRVPFDDEEFMFKHFGTCLYINSLYEAQILEEEPSKNYFEYGLGFVRKRVDAVWEIVRGFVLPRMFGPEYKEGLLLQMARAVGLFVPGIPAHGPQDYINATRLAIY